MTVDHKMLIFLYTNFLRLYCYEEDNWTKATDLVWMGNKMDQCEDIKSKS